MFLRVYQHTSRPYQLALCEWWVLVKFKVHVPFVQKFNFSRISSDIPVLFLSHGFWHQTTTVNYYTCFKLISMLCASLFLLDNLTAKHSLYNNLQSSFSLCPTVNPSAWQLETCKSLYMSLKTTAVTMQSLHQANYICLISLWWWFTMRIL